MLLRKYMRQTVYIDESRTCNVSSEKIEAASVR